MWGVRRRDAARHNESGWLIRPEMRSSSLSLGVFLFFAAFLFIFRSHFPAISRRNGSCRPGRNTYRSPLALLTHPGQHGSVSGDGACWASDDLVHRICLG